MSEGERPIWMAAQSGDDDDAIDEYPLFLEQELCVRSRVDHPSQLQELAQPNGVVSDGNHAHDGGAGRVGAFCVPDRHTSTR